MTTQNFVTLPREVVEQMTQALDLGYALLESSKSYHAPTLLACYHLGRAALTEQVQPAQSKGLFIDLIAAEGPEFVAEMAAIGGEPAQGGCLTDLAIKAGASVFDKDGNFGRYQAGSVLFTPSEWDVFIALLQSNAEQVPMTGEAWLTKGQQ